MDTITWHLITLDAIKILCDIPEKNIVQRDGNFTVLFKYDLSDKNNLINREVILKEDIFADNALFFQLNKLLPNSQDIREKDALRRSIVFVDFSELFRKNENILSKAKPCGETLSKENLLSEKALPYRLNLLFKDGLFLSFDGQNFRKFVPFDKSNSMARSCQITFIDEKIKDALDKRLMLDMNFCGEKLVLSKFFAYRGLYLSSAFRINEAKDFPLNEETVVVLRDVVETLHNAEVFTASENEKGELLNYGLKTKTLNLNSFDGEGLISPDFAEYVSNFLQHVYHFSAPSNSFQIRMPFTKGVLHAVDFKKFFAEQLPPEVDRLLVEDIFGKTRDLYKAKIILTESMFKCAGWCKRIAEKMEAFAADPMKFFFDKFKEYEHALYVTNTEARLSNPGRIRLNYQFLSTLALEKADFDSLVKEHCESVNSLWEKFTTNPTSSLAEENSVDDTDVETDEEDDTELKEEESNIPSSIAQSAFLKAAKKNPAFLQDPKVKDIFADIVQNHECNLGLGRLEVDGEQRFLSCDLLALLTEILDRAQNVKLEERKKKFLRKQCLEQNHFFMPENKLPLEPDKQYAFLRNPHLSRNEQVLLSAYVNCDSLHSKFFSRLKGVVMIAKKSTAAMSLGGADFDGDLVKVISDSRIVQAVKRGKRNLPPIEIPAKKAKVERLGNSVPLSLIVNTFASKVGQISNWAVTLSEREYSAQKDVKIFENACAKCTLTVGLEIDAAKTGFHPEPNINELSLLMKNCHGQSLFLKAKKVIRQILRWPCTPTVVLRQKVYLLYLSRKVKERAPSKLQVDTEPKSDSVLENLPARFIQFLYEQQTIPEKLPASGQPYFKFEVSGWRKNLDNDKREKVISLTKAYLRVLSLDRKIQRMKNFLRKREFGGHLANVLNLQYDDLNQKLSCGTEVNEALYQLCADLASRLKNSENVRKALAALKTEKWHLTGEKDRPFVAAKIIELASGEKEDLPAAFELLYNFRCNGYMLFYYVLKELESRFAEEDVEEWERRIIEDPDSVPEKNSSQIDKCDAENEYYAKLNRIYSKAAATKKVKSIWNEELKKSCREILSEIFGESKNRSEALKYFWSQKSNDPERNFLWNVFEDEDILPQI